ncbi:hypothetical protein CHS0354_012882 [Potamilus streckersoni]|uniref:Chitin-binding type-4 domain-containing protein n=1 Tax=Potamilus streckersoni TaxID=2493646 RepID=A0AAE0SW87_9BIVA|nr:hypothetical protein CHS0354_012882 [Potamilus streckersoni]
MTTKIIIYLILCIFVRLSHQHGYMIDPPQRSSIWREGHPNATEINYTDNQLFCGGFSHQWNVNDGKCGTCGDPYDGPQENEAGGRYAKGIIVRTYEKEAVIDVKVQMTAVHLGWFEFRICPHNDVNTPVSQACLNRTLLYLPSESGTRYSVNNNNFVGLHTIKIQLPANMTCSQCIIQWHYNTGNSWGCENNMCGLGLGKQETFINCADVAIVDTSLVNTSATPSLLNSVTSNQISSTVSSTISTTSSDISINSSTNTTTATTTTSGNQVCTTDKIISCSGAGLYESIPNMDTWCLANCRVGFCPSTHCQCQC